MLGAGGRRATLTSLADAEFALFEACEESDAREFRAFGLSPDERELWAIESQPATSNRYALPEQRTEEWPPPHGDTKQIATAGDWPDPGSPSMMRLGLRVASGWKDGSR